MRAPLGAAALVAALLLPPRPARAEAAPRLDHRGALGLSLAPGVEHVTFLAFPQKGVTDANFASLELTGSMAVGASGNEVSLTARGLRGPGWALAVAADFRDYFGPDEWKTFFDLGFKGDTAPGLALGPHADFGLMYEFGPLLGAFAKLGGSLELGQGLRGAFEGSLGLQARSYLLQ